MNTNHNILQNLVNTTPKGIVLTSDYLKQNGVSTGLAWWYVHSKWLERLADKAYKKPNDVITWSGVLYTLQTIHGLDIHASGRTALELAGKGHYLYMSDGKTINLARGNTTKLPSWFKKQNFVKEEFAVHKSSLIGNDNNDKYLNSTVSDGLTIKYSCAELALLEILNKCKTEHDYEEASQLMESFPYLRSPIVQELLEKSASIMATRLYLHFAEKHKHGWYAKLDKSKFNLGTGKRIVGDGEYFDKLYQLYVPLLAGY